MLSIFGMAAHGASGVTKYDYRITDVCTVEMYNLEGEKESPPVEYEKVIYRFDGSLRRPMTERRITLYRENRRPIDLICRIDMVDRVHEAWLERPTKWEREIKAARLKTRKLKLEKGKLPMLGEFRYETIWFSPCGEYFDIWIDDVQQPEFDLSIPIEEVAYEISEITNERID